MREPWQASNLRDMFNSVAPGAAGNSTLTMPLYLFYGIISFFIVRPMKNTMCRIQAK